MKDGTGDQVRGKKFIEVDADFSRLEKFLNNGFLYLSIREENIYIKS